MKKFFSMFAFAMMALAMVSCGNKDEDSKQDEGDTRTSADLCLVTAVDPDQVKFYDYGFEVTVGSSTQTVKLSEMTEFTDADKTNFETFYNAVVKEVAGVKNVKYYKYDLGEKAINSKVTVYGVATVLEDHPTTGEFNILAMADFFEEVDGKYKSLYNTRDAFKGVYKGIAANDEEVLAKFAAFLSQHSYEGTIN